MRYTSHIHTSGNVPSRSGSQVNPAWTTGVWDAVRDGRVDEVVQCNVDGIVRLRGVFSRLTFAPPAVEIAT